MFLESDSTSGNDLNPDCEQDETYRRTVVFEQHLRALTIAFVEEKAAIKRFALDKVVLARFVASLSRSPSSSQLLSLVHDRQILFPIRTGVVAPSQLNGTH